MRPLTSNDVTSKILADRPFLLLNVSAFDVRYVGSLLAKAAIKSKGGITLPPEVWFKIFEIFKSVTERKGYHLARVLTATSQGESAILSCEIEMSALTSPLADLSSAQEVLALEEYMAAPDGNHDISFLESIASASRSSPTSIFFSITLTDRDDEFLPHCLFHELTVPDVIAHLQDYLCGVCGGKGGRTICPGCTGGVAQRFGAFMGCGVNLACPLCLGLDFMQEDKALLQTYYWDDMPEEEEIARGYSDVEPGCKHSSRSRGPTKAIAAAKTKTRTASVIGIRISGVKR